MSTEKKKKKELQIDENHCDSVRVRGDDARKQPYQEKAEPKSRSRNIEYLDEL